MEERQVVVDAVRSVSVSVHGDGDTAVLLGHGAGGTRKTPFLLRVAESIVATGRRAALFNFPYTESGRRLPDPPALLEATVARVAESIRGLGAKRLVLGGKSMGGRIASQAVAQGLAADALLFLGYPLHPPGRTDKLRDKHLPNVAAPMLFVQGTRDEFARWDLLEATLARLGDRATLLRIEDGDHSFLVRKKVTGKTTTEVERGLLAGVMTWLEDRGL